MVSMSADELLLLGQLADGRRVLSVEEIAVANKLVGRGLALLQPLTMHQCDCCLTEEGHVFVDECIGEPKLRGLT